jgi:hypothetical protein
LKKNFNPERNSFRTEENLLIKPFPLKPTKSYSINLMPSFLHIFFSGPLAVPIQIIEISFFNKSLAICSAGNT